MAGDQHWEHLLSVSRKITEQYPDAVFIGGIAVFAHAARFNAQLAEASHDADLYLSLLGKHAMRDQYEVVRNERLGKDSVLVDGEDLDLYVERQHHLAIGYEELFAYAADIDGIRVAALEHLLILKIDAASDRRGTSKGQKDLRDLARLLALLSTPRKELLGDHLSKTRLAILSEISRRRDLFSEMGINRHEASKLNRVLERNVKILAPRLSRGLLR
jgi:hypothetical protein